MDITEPGHAAPTDARRTATGPTSTLGKAKSAANSVVHGLATQGTIMPSETVEMYVGNLAAWLATVPARTPGERQTVARIADVAFRYDRLARLEVNLANANLDRKVSESAPTKAKKLAQDALDGVRADPIRADAG